MTTERDLLRAICLSPEDMLARLVYADWLEENAGVVACEACVGTGKIDARRLSGYLGEKACSTCTGAGSIPDGRMARAEFIRVQCRIDELQPLLCSHCRSCSWCGKPDHYGLCTCHSGVGCLRYRDRELLKQYSAEWSGIAGKYSRLSDFRRGFVESVSMTVGEFRRHGPDLVEVTPLLKVEFTDPSGSIAYWWAASISWCIKDNLFYDARDSKAALTWARKEAFKEATITAGA